MTTTQAQMRTDFNAAIQALDARLKPMEADWPIVKQIKTAVEWGVKIILCGAFVAVLAVAGVKVYH